jgi:hypothetical protein
MQRVGPSVSAIAEVVAMSLFQSSSRQQKPHTHTSSDRCPTCDQPIGQDIARHIEQRRREQDEAATAKARAETAAATQQKLAEAAAAAEQKIAAMRTELKAAAEAAATQKLAGMQAKLAQAEQANLNAGEQIVALKAEQAAAVEKRVAEALEAMQRQKEDLQREKDGAILAANAKVLKLTAELADMQRKLEGKTANELGEGSEVDLFEELRTAFEGDRIRRVGKGVNGADVIHEIVHNGKVCGKIIYDSKNRDSWQNGFATKLHADKLAEKADHAVLSSNKFPKGAQQLHLQDGVIVASPARIKALAELLRRQILQMHQLRVSGEAREQKSEALYAFITSERCKQLLDSIEAQAGRMLELDASEEKAHRLTWERRNKLIQSVKKVQGDLVFEIDRIIGTAGNGPEDEEAA